MKSRTTRSVVKLLRRRTAHALTALALGVALAPHAQAANTVLYWDADGTTTTATGGTGLWDLVSLLWRNGSATGALQAYDNTNPSTVTANFSGTAGTVTIAAGKTINVNNVTFGTTGYTIAGTNGTSVLNFSGTTPTITNSSGGAVTISAKITGTGLTQTGGGFTVLSGDLTGLSGTVNVGTRINLDGTKETGSQNQTWNVTGTLSSENHGTTSTVQLGALTGNGVLRIGNNGTGVADSGTDIFQIGALNTDTTFSGSIQNHNAALTAITKVGTGTLTLSGANSYTGATTISGGTLQIGNGGTTGTLGSTSNIVDNGSLVFNLSNTFQTASNNPTISGSGTITQAGTGTVILTGANTNTGTTFINSGTLQVSANGTSAALGSGNIVDNGTLAFARTNAITVNNIISGNGTVSQIGTGVLTLTGANSYQGGTTIKAGTVTLGNTSALGAVTGALTLSGGMVNPNGTRGTTLDMNSNSASVGVLTSADQSSFNGFNLGSSPNTLTASSASINGTNYIGITNAADITSTGTYNLISSGSAMTGGGTFTFTGAQDLTVPVNSIIVKNSSGNFYRLTLNNTGTTEQMVVTNTGLGNTINIMPLGASISYGSSSTGTSKNGTNIISYNGSGYHTQLYQNLVNDGRFNPNFVGSATGTGAVNPAGPNILSMAGQTASEGHPGYTNSQVLANLNNWLAPGNGVDPDYILMNVGGNDLTGNKNDANAVLRYDAIVTQVNALRPGVATILTSLMYRLDAGVSQDTLFNPSVPGIVYNHILAGQNVRYLDLYTLLSPSDNQSVLSSDGTHPIQAGYDQEANALSQSLLYGAAYYKGGNNGVWNSTTSFAVDSGLTTDRQKLLDDPSAVTYAGINAASQNTTLTFYPDVWFNNNTTALSTTLGEDTTVRSLNFAAGATGAVSVGGANTLTIGAGGITVQPGTGAHTVSANVALAADQTWGNVSSNPFTVSGVVSGSQNLTITGSYTTYNPGTPSGGIYTPTATTYSGTGSIVLSGANTYSGGTTVSSGTLVLAGAANANNATGTGNILVTGNGSTLLLGADNQIANTANLELKTITGGPSVVFSLADHNETLGTLTEDPATIDFGSAAAVSNTLHFADSHLQTWSGILSITNYQYSQTNTTTFDQPGVDHLFFGTDNTGLSSAQLSQISFVNPTGLAPGTYGATILFNGEIAPTPEPGSVVPIVIGMAGLGVLIARRRKANAKNCQNELAEAV